MGATKDGGKKTRDKLLEKDPNYYSNISKKATKPRGGRHSANSFDKNPELAKTAGAIGGRKSKRGKGKRLNRQ